MVISFWPNTGKNQKTILCVHEKPILETSFVTLTEKSSIITNNTLVPQEYPHDWKEL